MDPAVFVLNATQLVKTCSMAGPTRFLMLAVNQVECELNDFQAPSSWSAENAGKPPGAWPFGQTPASVADADFGISER